MADAQWVMGEGTDNQFAWLENDEGRNVVCIERLAGKTADGRLTFVGPAVHGDDAPDVATTDEQWQSIVDVIAAAPEMVAVLKQVRSWVEAGLHNRIRPELDIKTVIDAVLAKAEPPRKVKKRMLVTVEVEVAADDGADETTLRAAANEAVVVHEGDSEFFRGPKGGGTAVKVKSKTVTTLGELYED